VSTLARVAGVQNLELAEDAVQGAFTAALERWRTEGLPEDPGGWLYRVAHNRLIGELRAGAVRRRILETAAGDIAVKSDSSPASYLAGEVRDDLLRMLFVCCHDAVPVESRLVFALKVLCGFGTAEIALRLFTSEANVHKRLARARERLRASAPDLDSPPLHDLRSRLPGVHAVLYLLFNEGYLSAQDAKPIRRDLCEEAIRLATLVAEHPVGAVPETFALLALMHLHAARLGARLDGEGELLLLEEDRSRWDRARMQLGMQWLERAASGDVFSRYHAEAGIAAEHCLASSFRETRWEKIADLYAMLESIAPSPLHTMNRAVAVAEWRGPDAGLALLRDLTPPPSWLTGSYLWEAVLSDLHRSVGHAEAAGRHADRGLALAPTDAIRRLLQRRLGR
jgi:RNA polymerase sigma factor (sigma-70 family)